MEYSLPQLKFIQKRVIETAKQLNAKDGGFSLIMVYADWTTWVSHAQLAGYSVEKDTGKMYKQKGNVRTYFEA